MLASHLIVILPLLLSTFLHYCICSAFKPPICSDNTKSVAELIRRIVGEKSSLFDVCINASLNESGLDVFRIIKTESSNRVEIHGSSGVAVAWGFHYYLKEFCNCHISWDGDQINLPKELPNVNINVTANDRYRYYQNVVTTSYSFVWWNWTRWEREIDWMALNGFNLALAFNGQESIWHRVYLKYGLNQSDIDAFFTGPAFLSWNRMGNLQAWGGPLTDSWHKYSVTLQKMILQRMRELDITPVLPAFAGVLPRAFKRIYPKADLTPVRWVGFTEEYCCVLFLSPLDKMFAEIGSAFLTEYIKEFGTNHIYNCDSFNELTPPKSDVEYLKKVGGAVFEGMTNVDGDAIWMMQGWLFHNQKNFWTAERSKALLTSVPQGRMLILDLMAELDPQYARLDSFFGQPFIWCMLHNFGGNLGLQGNVRFVNENIFKARSFPNSSMVGTGITPEGINQNYVIYDLMNEMSWRKEPVDLEQWFEKYASRRYGQSNKNAHLAWTLLRNSVYNYEGEEHHARYTFLMQPSFHLDEDFWYNKEDVWKAWDHLVNASQEMDHPTITFLYDLVDVTRQSLQLCLHDRYQIIISAFRANKTKTFKVETDNFLNIMGDMDEILGSLPHFLLGRWLNDAKALGTTPLEKSIYERNARNQITLWGPNGEIVDYANKQWAGLMQDYYAARWELFFKRAYSSLIQQTPFDEFQVSKEIFKNVEEHFTYSIKKYSIHPKGDPVKLALLLNNKWRPRA